MPEAFIEAKNLRKTYHVGKIDVEALRGISFSVQKGEFVSVVGPSGSGKSTLFYLLGGLTRADGGSVVLDGDDLATLSDAQRTRMRKRKIGFVFQKFNLLSTLDARSNIAIAREISGNGEGDPAHFNRITDLLGLTKRLGHRPQNFPEASSSAWLWRARSSTNPRSSWRTNLPATWIPRTPTSCSACCAGRTRNWARPC